MKKLLKILLKIGLVFLVVFLLFIGLFVVPYLYNIVMPWNRSNAIESALEWGGLAELPDEAHNISVGTDGNMFTRSFSVDFECDNSCVEAWVKKSGLDKLEPLKVENGVTDYWVPGQKGSIGGHVYVDLNKHTVVIHMSWS